MVEISDGKAYTWPAVYDTGFVVDEASVETRSDPAKPGRSR
jgi:hypothetical protein